MKFENIHAGRTEVFIPKIGEIRRVRAKQNYGLQYYIWFEGEHEPINFSCPPAWFEGARIIKYA